MQPNKSQNEPSLTALPHKLDGIPLLNILSGPARQRMVQELTEAHYGKGIKDPNGIRLTVRMTRQDMANMVGITTETAIRIMSRFKRDRLMSGTANLLVILDLPRLKKFAFL
jgi:CRP-like cAMP-binding protein